MNNSMNVLIVDDSIMMRALLKEFLKEHGETVVAEAQNGKQAVELAGKHDPDFIIMDIDMPVMNGIEAAGIILAEKKRPLMILAHDISGGKAEQLFQLGAAEVMEKPPFDRFNDAVFSEALIEKMRSIVSGFRHSRSSPSPAQKTADNGSSQKETAGAQLSRIDDFGAPVEQIVMGASTGGPEAVRIVLEALPADLPVNIALVQHIESRFAPGYAEWLNTHTALEVRLAGDAKTPEPGCVDVAPGGVHLTFRRKQFHFDDSEPVKNQKPAVEKLFASAADNFKTGVLGVLLTGMGSDGADGALAIREQGGYMIVQDKESSFIFGMPGAAVAAGAASAVLPLAAIPGTIVEAVHARP